MAGRPHTPWPGEPEGRLQQLGWLLGVGFLLLAVRLWQLQVMEGSHYAVLAESNRVRQVPVRAPRGLIYDRNGRLLVGNRLAFTISVVPESRASPRPELFGHLAGLLEVPEEILVAAWQAGYAPGSFEPVRVWRDASPRQVIAVEEHREALPGVVVEEEPVREYPGGPLAAHVLGYLGVVTREELRQLGGEAGYRGTDLIGRTGLERELETLLRGQEGRRAVEVDALERPRRVLEEVAPRPGHNLHLTVDLELQQALERALAEGLRQARAWRDQAYPDAPVPVGGAGAVVLDSRTGAVLALASLPGFDPGALAPWNRDLATYYRRLVGNPGRPLFNRVTQGLYPPGSTFKVVTALAALETGVFEPGERWLVDGRGPYGKVDWWRTSRVPVRNPEGQALSLVEGFEWSSNDFFWELGRRVGIQRLAEWGRRFGFGQRVGLDLHPPDDPGLVPDPAWKRRRFATPAQQLWYEAETLDVAIGQGALQVTLLQIAAAYMAVANDGIVYRPYLVGAVTDADGKAVYVRRPQVLRTVPAPPATWALLRRGLARVVSGQHGTARSAFAGFPVPVGGKTGSAQLAGLEGAGHALFAAIAPVDDPEVVVTVVVEHGGSGAAAAAPIARRILEAYFRLRGAADGAGRGAPGGGSPAGSRP